MAALLRTLARSLGAGCAALVLSGVYLAARILAPWRLGRLLSSVSLPRMQEHKLRTTLTALGIALGVAVLVSVVLVSRSIVRGVTETMDDVAGKADLQISASSSGFDETLLDTARSVPGVFKLTPVLQQIVPLRTERGQRERLLLLGVELLGNDDAYFRDYGSQELDDIRRDSFSFLNSTGNLILSRKLADRLGVKLHDKLSIGTSAGFQTFEVWGFVDAPALGRAFSGAVGIMYYPAMQVAFERGRNIDRIDIAVKPGSDPERVAAALEAALGEGITVERPALRGDRVSKLLTAVRTALSMACVIAVLAGAFLVFNTISISIVQRKRELGILRALGTTRRELSLLLTLEGLLLGLVGSALGVGVGLGLAQGMLRVTTRAVDKVYLQQAVREVQLDPALIALGFGLGTLASVGAAWLAARRTAGLRPSEALSSAHTWTPREKGSRAADLTALALFAAAAVLASLPPLGMLPLGPLAACIMIVLGSRAAMPRAVTIFRRALGLTRGWVGTTTNLATDNIARDLSRTASTASGLMAGAALTVSSATFIVSFIASLNTWSTQTLPGDLFVTSGASVAGLSSRNNPMADSLQSELLAIPGVERTRRIRFVDASFRDSPFKLASTDVREFVKRSHFSPTEGDAGQIARDVLAGAVAVSENFSRLFDVHRGDTITLGAKDGPRSFKVAGVILDYTSDRGTVTMDRATYVAGWNDTRVDTYELHVRRGVTPEAVRTQINERLSAQYDLFVLTNSEFRGELVHAVDEIFGLMRALELVTLLVAALGMITAVLANVLDRVREIGVLRAIGMLRGQVGRLIVVESTLVGGIGAFVGILVGTVLGYVLLRRIATVQMGWFLPYRLPISAMVELVLITLPLSALAGLYPAREAARLQVRDALDYE